MADAATRPSSGIQRGVSGTVASKAPGVVAGRATSGLERTDADVASRPTVP